MNYEERIKNLASKSKYIQLYKPATFDLILRSENKLVGCKIAPELREIYKITNGAGFLDYGLVGCKNHKILDIAENTLDIWCANNNLCSAFVGFISTSGGENFGYLPEIKNKSGSYPVAYLQNLCNQGMLVISSSISLFFESFFTKLEETIENSPNEIYISDETWPSDLNYWLRNDPELVELYKSGQLEKYYHDDTELKGYIDDTVSKF